MLINIIRRFIVSFIFFGCLVVDGQGVSKPMIDSAVFDKWPQMGSLSAITNDGRYVFYFERNIIPGAKEFYVLQATTGSWKKEYSKNTECRFTSDNKTAILRRRDSLCFLRLGGEEEQCRLYVNSAELYSFNKKDWLVYTLKDSSDKNALHIRDLKTQKEYALPSVDSYEFFPKTGYLLLTRELKSDEGNLSYSWYNLSASRMEDSVNVKNTFNSFFSFDFIHDQLCFLSEAVKGDPSSREIYYCKRGMSHPEVLFNSKQIPQNNDELAIDEESRPNFSKDGQHIFFILKKKKPLPQNPNDKVKVNVWSYTDKALPTEQDYGIREMRCVVSAVTKNFIQLDNDSTRVSFDFGAKLGEGESTDFIVTESPYDGIEWWRDQSDFKTYLVSLKDGSTVPLPKKAPASNLNRYFLSPLDTYLIYYDPDAKNYYSYNIKQRTTLNLTQSVAASWVRTDINQSADPNPMGIAGWLPDDKAVLVYDEYDIWKIDPSGVRPPVNLTHGYGAAHRIRLRLTNITGLTNTIIDQKILLLSAFNTQTKYGGFYSQALDGLSEPVLLNMGPYAYTHVRTGIQDRVSVNKAAFTDVYIVRRESAMESANLFVTKDFRTFKALSNIHPERNYNWLVSEVVNWEMPDGNYNQGILYKPEDFDSTKKYPLIFNYYEARSDELYEYKVPNEMTDNINVPWFVSRGYLVFIPDIRYTKPTVGESAVNSVVSAAKYLSRYSWVDSTKMGIQGHSFGGEETNYLVAHTHLFAAACEAAGPTDAISGYAGLRGTTPVFGSSGHNLFEMSQGRIRFSLPERPDLYIDETVIFHANRVTTPLLMMHNKNDGNVPWMQGMEFFPVLRRMGKRAWLLEYDNSSHVLNGNRAKDYTRRMTQFFDHYLKGTPPPLWMTQGVPMRNKGLDYGYDLDLSGNEPQEIPVLYKGKMQKVSDVEVDK